MNKGSKYKSGERPTFRIWDNEKNDWFKPTYDGWNGKIEELLLSPAGDLTMRTFTGFIHESVFPDRFEIFRDELPITDEQAWNKIAEAYPETAQSLRIILDQAVYGHEAEPQKVKVPMYVAKWISKCRELNWILPDLLAPEAFESSFARNTEEWLRQDKQNYDILARAWLDGYEVEEEPKWVVKVGNLYFCGWEDTTAQFVMNTVLGEDESIIKYKNEGTASSVAKNLGGTVEKV